MNKIGLFIACLYAVLLRPNSGLVAEPAEGVANSIEVEDVSNSNEGVAFTSPDQPAIRSNFVNSKQFFLVTTEKVNWFKAAHICKFNGMELASIDSTEENNIISMLINTSGCGDEAQNLWTSGNDLGASREWYWLANGKPIEFTNWGTDEPNNINERCLELRWKDTAWSWNDRTCTTELFFICEMKFK
ncbi:C-type lectin 37Db-like [Bradysia coprophila]|uniref:C-type lectin 37Db-like n=1 Tax=Bradysia coprophila TaxID=38358 RepID=UPI00187DB00B|nr:C-type lectin 37Db-like [Bradysia coprophila]